MSFRECKLNSSDARIWTTLPQMQLYHNRRFHAQPRKKPSGEWAERPKSLICLFVTPHYTGRPQRHCQVSPGVLTALQVQSMSITMKRVTEISPDCSLLTARLKYAHCPKRPCAYFNLKILYCFKKKKKCEPSSASSENCNLFADGELNCCENYQKMTETRGEQS